MIVWPAAERPAKLAVELGDGLLVDAGVGVAHQAIGVGLPALVAIGAEPVAAVVTIFLGVADGDPVVREGPQLRYQAVIQLRGPLPFEKDLGLVAAAQELGAVSPTGVGCVGQGDLGAVVAANPILEGRR